MANENQLDELLQKVEDIRQKHFKLQIELGEVKRDILNLQDKENIAQKPVNQAIVQEWIAEPKEKEPEVEQVLAPQPEPEVSPVLRDWEQFIGENLSNKIGIVITVLGVVIGAKYAIDNDLISPLMRILLGYVLGFGLCIAAFRLREKYEDLSAVILSGAMASLYFLTYAAFSFYQLIPQTLSFVLMLALTVWAVRAALSYERQMIALGALMGAYGIPFLLSTGEDKPLVLFTYMAIVNIGILYLATRKSWNSLYYTAFAFSWLTLMTWSFSGYPENHFYLKLFFLFLFFALFYATFLVYKIRNQVIFRRRDVVILLINSTLYYALTYSVLDNGDWRDYLGFFTVCTALIHLAVAFFIYKKDLADKNVFYLVQGLFITFLTIAIPVQFDGDWVTLSWVIEGALLFWIARTKTDADFYEKIAYAILVLSLLSLFIDWSGYYNESFRPMFNIAFWSNVICTATFGFVLKTQYDFPKTSDDKTLNDSKLAAFSLIVISLCFITFFLEISRYFDFLIQKSRLVADYYTFNEDIARFKSIWLINYSMAFLGLLFYVNKKYVKNIAFVRFIDVLSLIVLFVFLAFGLYILGDLKNAYQYNFQAENFKHSSLNIWIRYLSIAFAMIPLYILTQHFNTKKEDKEQKIFLDTVLNISALWLISSELIYWSEWYGWYEQSYRLSLSLLWGLYALGLIFYGIKNIALKHLRIGGMALFAITLAKLFLFDLANLDTISKTIVLVGLGLLLLLVSYLYNRYKSKFE